MKIMSIYIYIDSYLNGMLLRKQISLIFIILSLFFKIIFILYFEINTKKENIDPMDMNSLRSFINSSEFLSLRKLLLIPPFPSLVMYPFAEQKFMDVAFIVNNVICFAFCFHHVVMVHQY